jgi:hypothetical protein
MFLDTAKVVARLRSNEEGGVTSSLAMFVLQEYYSYDRVVLESIYLVSIYTLEEYFMYLNR